MADASLVTSRKAGQVYVTVAAAVAIGEVIQLPDGRAGVLDGLSAAAAGDRVAFSTIGQYVAVKDPAVAILDGGHVFWDYSTNQATYRRGDDRDFLLGCAVGDAPLGDTTLTVDLNVKPCYVVDLARDSFVTALVGTQALGGLGIYRRGGATKLVLSATNEAQKSDALSREGFATAARAIIEFAVTVNSVAGGAATDVSVGVANATHATDADAIADRLFVHLDGDSANVYFESADGTTTVAATDSTIDFAAGTRFEVWMDMRAPGDVQIYVNGVNVLLSTVFNVSASANTWKLLAHVEKTATTDAIDVDVDWLRARIQG